MDTQAIIESIDKEIGNLQQARDILAGAKKPPQRETGKRILSPEARQRIAAAQKKRWEKQRAA